LSGDLIFSLVCGFLLGFLRNWMRKTWFFAGQFVAIGVVGVVGVVLWGTLIWR
jgi:hypothetical protein